MLDVFNRRATKRARAADRTGNGAVWHFRPGGALKHRKQANLLRATGSSALRLLREGDNW